jgi:hypothetical protein
MAAKTAILQALIDRDELELQGRRYRPTGAKVGFQHDEMLVYLEDLGAVYTDGYC